MCRIVGVRERENSVHAHSNVKNALWRKWQIRRFGVLLMTIHKNELNPLKIDPQRLFSTGEAACVLGCNRCTIRNYLNAGSLIGIRVNNNWRVTGQELIDFLHQNAPRKTFLEYPSGQVIFPQSGYLIYRMISTFYNRKLILDECGRYGLLKPLVEELDKLWASIKITAPAGLRKQLRPGSQYILSLGNAEVAGWVERLGIKDLFGHKVWPCQNILEDRSEKRLSLEVMICGRMTHKEIVNYMVTKYNFLITEDQVDFFARHFFNLYNYSAQDRYVYLSRLEDRTEKYYKQKSWGDPECAKATLQIPTRVNFEEMLNLVAAIAGLNFKEYAMGGPGEMPMAKDASQMIFHAHRQLLALNKDKSEQTAAAIQKSQAEGAQISPFEKKSEEAPSFDELDQPDSTSENQEVKAG